MTAAISTRRDPRYALRCGSGTVEFAEALPGTQNASAALTRISVAGLAFRPERPPAVDAGTIVKGVTVRVGDCRLHGDLVLQVLEASGSHDPEVGCLFYPSGPTDADRLMALIAGIEAAQVED